MKNIKRSDFASNLIKFRKQKGLSQVNLATLSGLSARMIAYYETHSINPPIDKVKIIANALEVKVSDLVDENKNLDEIVQIDPRILKVALMIKDLNRTDKESVYSIIKSLYEKQTGKSKEKELQEAVKWA